MRNIIAQLECIIELYEDGNYKQVKRELHWLLEQVRSM
jgi:hypothetical protein